MVRRRRRPPGPVQSRAHVGEPTWRPPSRGPFTPRHGLDGFLGKPALGLSIASNDPSNMVPRAKCWGVNEKIISRAVLELDDELAVSVCCHGTFLANLNRQCPARPGLFHAQTPSERRLDASDDYQVPHFTEVGSTKSAPPFETPRGEPEKKPRRSGAKGVDH